MDSVAWRAAGFTDRYGDLWDRTVRPTRLWIPRQIAVQKGVLRWDDSAGYSPKAVDLVAGDEGFLRGFLALKEASTPRILAYARSWGVLGLCRHGLPFTHGPVWEQREKQHLEKTGRWVAPTTICSRPVKREPLQAWRRYARVAEAMLNVAAALSTNRPPQAQDCRDLSLESLPGSIRWTRRFARDVLLNQLDEWLEMGVVTVRLRRAEKVSELGAVSLQLGRAVSPNLFAALAAQLLLALTRSDSLYICASCGLPYVRSRQKRRPKRGQRNYCSDCGRAAALRDADLRRRRKNLARRLHAEGAPYLRISRHLGCELSEVTELLKGKRNS